MTKRLTLNKRLLILVIRYWPLQRTLQALKIEDPVAEDMSLNINSSERLTAEQLEFEQVVAEPNGKDSKSRV